MRMKEWIMGISAPRFEERWIQPTFANEKCECSGNTFEIVRGEDKIGYPKCLICNATPKKVDLVIHSIGHSENVKIPFDKHGNKIDSIDSAKRFIAWFDKQSPIDQYEFVKPFHQEPFIGLSI